jgi:16S rRNA (adenine1518-N6/adenine1519-N6)-dimethyltransferase
MSRQKLGQHFLADHSWRQQIRQTLAIRPGETWLEIGAGHGEMTDLLAADGAHVIAIETDPRLIPGLRTKAAACPAIEIIAADVLETDLRQIVAGRRVRVYGNLPYYITSPILRHLFQIADCITSIHIVIQLEVAARIVAPPGRRDYGYLSTLCQFYAHPEIALRIPQDAFHPPPKVMSALVQMTLPGERANLGIENEPQFLAFLQACFAQKRKTLRNNLRTVAGAENLAPALESLGLSSSARAEELTLTQFGSLQRALAAPILDLEGINAAQSFIQSPRGSKKVRI